MSQIVLGDSLEVLKSIESKSVHLIISDPPYFKVSKENWDNQWKTEQEYLFWMETWTKECERILIDGGSLYVFGGIGSKNKFAFWKYIINISDILSFCSYVTWRRFRGKGYKGLYNLWPDTREDIAFFIKGHKPHIFNKQYMKESGLSSTSKKRFKETGVGLCCSNVWIDIPECQLNGGMNRTLNHPCEKPLKLIERIVLASSNENDLVLDPFAGSGVSALACIKNKRNYHLIEQEEKYYSQILENIDQFVSNEKKDIFS